MTTSSSVAQTEQTTRRGSDPTCLDFAIELLGTAADAGDAIGASEDRLTQWFTGDIGDSAVVRVLNRLADDIEQLSEEVVALGAPPPELARATDRTLDALDALEDGFRDMRRAVERSDVEALDEALADLLDAAEIFASLEGLSDSCSTDG